MTPAPTFERVYPALRQWLLSGEARPGDRLEPGLLADRLNTSVMPVRDALQRLVGERLAAMGQIEGFVVPYLTEPDLHDLYGWHLTLVLDALHRWNGAIQLPQRNGAVHTADRTALLFETIASVCGNQEHQQAIRSIGERLRAVRIAEADVLPDAQGELDRLETLLTEKRPVLRRAIVGYHRRRQREATRILRRVNGPAKPFF